MTIRRFSPLQKALAWTVAALLWAGGATIGLVGALHSNSVGRCVNNVLGDRADINAVDEKSDQAFTEGIAKATSLAQVKAAAARRAADQRTAKQAREAHPLGHC